MKNNQYRVFKFFVALLMNLVSYAQNNVQSFSKEFSIIEDNDFLLLQTKDGYYTNGFTLKLSMARPTNKQSLVKKINAFEIGQQLFTQQNRRAYSPADIDRPVAGYLFGKFTQSLFHKNQNLFQWGVSVGTIGKSSLGRNMHSFYHRQININSAFWGWNWQYQLKDEPGINLHATYAAPVLNKNSNSIFQIIPQPAITLGTTFTNLNAGVIVQLGKLNSLSSSGFWGAAIEAKNNVTTQKKKEVFLFYHPQLTYQVYNATIQGGLFRKDKGPITSSPQPFVLLQQIGVSASTHRLTASFTVALQTKEAVSQRANHSYGRSYLAYRFK